MRAFGDSGHGKPRGRNVIRRGSCASRRCSVTHDLRSRTQGRAPCTMHFSHYAEGAGFDRSEVIEKATGKAAR